MKKLPDDLSALDGAELHRAALTRDQRIAPLFHRWPKLTAREERDLRRLWTERLRVAKHLGTRRGRARGSG